MKLLVLVLALVTHKVQANPQHVHFHEFKAAVTENGYKVAPTSAQYDAFISNLELGGIKTKEEAAMALAQFIYETNGLSTLRDKACGLDPSKCRDKYRNAECDEKNQLYYGRGYIHMTGCLYYRTASKELFGDERLSRKPDLVASDEGIAWKTSFWLWKKTVHSKKGVKEGKFGATTKAIRSEECKKGKEKRARERFQFYVKVRKAFGLEGEGDSSGCYGE